MGRESVRTRERVCVNICVYMCADVRKESARERSAYYIRFSAIYLFNLIQIYNKARAFIF